MPLTDVLALADDGYGIAQHQLCYGYNYGVGIEQGYSRAFEWCSRAAQADDQPSPATLLGDL